MTTESHLLALQKKHQDLEQQIAELSQRPASDHVQVTALKKQKLAIKEELEALQENQT